MTIMTALEDIFNASVLDVVIPNIPTDIPVHSSQEWLDKISLANADRKQVFYDEQLQFFLTLRIELPEAADNQSDERPPTHLLEFLAHLHVTLEATYIPSAPAARTSLLPAPPRIVSLESSKSTLDIPDSPLYTPNTPNPTPATTDDDRRYVRSEGTVLLASTWGQNGDDNQNEDFSLIGLSKTVWVAVYKFTMTVAFLQLHFADPLLCLTLSATLREKSISTARLKHLSPTLLAAGSDPPKEKAIVEAANESRTGLDEVNLLDGLFDGPSFASDRIALLSSRLGVSSRRRMFSLPAVGTREHPGALPPASHPVLRKSFRKVVQTVSGFRVRMRTVIVPYVLPPGRDREQSSDDERRELGNEECTAILCVEIENTGEAGPGIGFMIEGADVAIGGDSATTSLIGWAGTAAFPLRVGTLEQINLLYAVSFLRSPTDVDRLSLPSGTGKRASMTELQKAIVIHIHGKPFVNEEAVLTHPTRTFSSRWNCVLDLSVPARRELDDAEGRDVLPEPPSPFPMSNTTHGVPPRIVSPEPPSGEDKPYLLGTPRAFQFKPDRSVTPLSSLPSRLRRRGHLPQRSVSLPALLSLTPAYTPPSTEGSGRTFEVGSAVSEQVVVVVPPVTPAYPAYSPEASGGSSPPSFAPVPPPQMDLIEGEPRGVVVEVVRAHEPLVISVRLCGGADGVRALHAFTLDVFVFNRSTRTRRLEIGYPDMRRGRGRSGLLSLDNRVRVGPLFPSTCQSVRMDFLALMPGVHTIETLVLTDVMSGASLNLRAVIDVVVHDDGFS